MGFDKYDGSNNGSIRQIKHPKKIKFKSLEESIESPEFFHTNYTDLNRSEDLHAIYKALNYMDIECELNLDVEKYKEGVDENLIEQVLRCRKSRLCPINSIIGGITSQEILKACTGKFSPIYQWMYFDAFECLVDDFLYVDISNKYNINSRYASQIYLFGEKFQKKLNDLKLFVVGAGAIGCELLKNFAMMGIGTIGKIYVTDMDEIEKSNLNRQFLFRYDDIGKSKAVAAKSAINKINPNTNIIAHRICQRFLYLHLF